MKLATRSLVGIGGLAWIFTLVGIFTQSAQGWIYWTSLAVFFVAWILGRVLSRDIAEKRPENLDEYEAELKNRARNVSYWASLLGGVALFMALTIFAGEARAGNPDLLLNAPNLLLAGVLGAAALPTFILTWTIRHEDS